jgi:Cu-processing system permease protein
MWQHALVAWRSGLRSRSFHALFILGALVLGGAYLASEFSGRQPATVALDVGISGVRFVALLMVVFWCQELVAREVEKRTVFLALAYPIPRAYYLLGRYFGVMVLAALAIVALGLMLMVSVRVAGGGYLQASPIDLGVGLWVTLVFVLLDVAVVGAFTLLIATVSTTPLLPLALGVAFAMAARSLGTTLAYLRDKDSGAATDWSTSLGPVVDALQWLIPDLGRLDIRALALYSQAPNIQALVLSSGMCFAYIVVILAIAIQVFRRRQFM